MRPFNEVLREAKQGNRPAVTVNVVNPEDLVNPVVRNPISKKGKQKQKPQGPALPSSAQRAKRFSQSFGTPTGANPFTGKATYVPPEALTKLPPSGKGTVDQSAYSNVDVGDLERKRGARTAEVPGKPGVRAANPEGVRNYALSQGGYARSGRNMSASEFADRSTRANTIAANPNSPEYKKIETKINQEVGGRRATRARSSPAGISADAAFRKKLDLDTPEGAAANRDFAKEMERLRRQNKGERDLLAAIDDVDAKPSGRQGSQGRRSAVSTSQTPSQVIAQTQQSQRTSQAAPTKITPGKTKPGTGLYTPPVKPVKTTAAAPSAPAPVATQAGRRLRTPRSARPSVITPSALEKALTKNRQQTALAQQAQNTKAAVQNAKALKNVARVGTGVAAYFDFQRASQAAKERGAGERRATARGAVEAGARVLGTTAGFIAGTPLGPVGQTVGGIGGGEYAVKKSGQAFERIFGKPGDAVTTQSVKRNIKSVVREKIPQNIRSQVPTSVRKGFSSFLDTAADAAKKGYGLYTKGKKLMDFSNPGDKK